MKIKKKARASKVEQPKKQIYRYRLIRILLIGLIAFCTISIGMAISVWLLVHDLPDQETIKRYRPYLSTEVRDVNNKLILSLGKYRNRLWCSLKTNSPWLVKAVITSEDDTFLRHSGLRMEQIRKAFWKNLESHRYAMGGSTITQQLAKNAFLSREKTITRKIREIFLARRMERALTKWRILELYLNEVEWGDGIYGSHTAALFYFGKSVRDLNIAESALLASILPNPKYFNPFTRLDKVKRKQKRVLRLMHTNGIITEEELEAALEIPIKLRSDSDQSFFNQRKRMESCFHITLAEYLEKHLGSNKLYRGGNKIALKLNMSVQKHLEQQFGMGSGELLLVARDDQIIRAFTCIGGTQWETTEINQKSTSAESPQEDVPEKENSFSEEISTEEETELEADSTLTAANDTIVPSIDDVPKDSEMPIHEFPYQLEKLSKKKFMNESLIIIRKK